VNAKLVNKLVNKAHYRSEDRPAGWPLLSEQLKPTLGQRVD
jgi:hypothetical protein